MKLFDRSALRNIALRNIALTTWCLTGALAFATPHIALAQPAPAASQAAASVGVIDEDKLNENYSQFKTAMDDFEKRRVQLRDQVSAGVFLPAASTKRFGELLLNEKRSTVEQTELDGLIKTGTGLKIEYETLASKTAPSDADTTRIKQIEAAVQASNMALQEDIGKLQNNFLKSRDALLKDYSGRYMKVIEQVAVDKKLLLVASKDATVWNSATVDITDEVLTRLNKS